MSNSETKKPEAAHRTIYVRVVLDVASVLQQGPDRSQDKTAPAAERFDPAQMIVTTTGGTTDPNSGDITLEARAGDRVRFFAKSGSNNFEHAVLVADMRAAGPDTILKDSEILGMPRLGVAPPADGRGPAAKSAPLMSWFRQYAVSGDGTQVCGLVLALYDRDEDGKPRFAGLFRWDVRLTVHASPTQAT